MDFILTNNLTIFDRGDVPTFVNRIREEVIDLTLTMGRACDSGLEGLSNETILGPQNTFWSGL